MNSHIYNLQERTECNKVEPKLSLWVINYEVKNTAKGIAVVKARNAKEALSAFMSETSYNGTKDTINITRIEEIFTSMHYTGLLSEEYITF